MKLCKEVAVRTKEKDDVNEFDELIKICKDNLKIEEEEKETD